MVGFPLLVYRRLLHVTIWHLIRFQKTWLQIWPGKFDSILCLYVQCCFPGPTLEWSIHRSSNKIIPIRKPSILFSKNGKLIQGSSVNATDQIFMFKTVASLTITLRSETLRPSTGEIEGVLLLAQHSTLAWDLWNKKFHKFAAGKNDWNESSFQN